MNMSEYRLNTVLVYSSPNTHNKITEMERYDYRIFDSKDCDCIMPTSRSMLDNDWRFSAALRESTGAGGATHLHQ